MDDKKFNETMDKLKELAEETLQELREKHPEMKEHLDAIDAEWKTYLDNLEKEPPKQWPSEDKKIYCECLGDIQYEQALTKRFPFKPAHEDQLREIEAYGEGSTEGAKISIDRNKGYCHTKLYNMCWQTNGEPIIIEKAMQRTGPLLVGAVHYADHPEWFPTPEDLNEFTESEVNV